MMTPRRLLLFSAALIGLAAAGALIRRASTPAVPPYLDANAPEFLDPQIAVQSSPDFNMLQNLAASIPHVERLFDPRSSYTAFAPRNVAFAKLPRSLLNEIWVPDNNLWSRVFWHHFSPTEIDREQLERMGELQMMDGSPVHLHTEDGVTRVDGVPIIGVLRARAWMIYVIDSLLVPDSAKEDFLSPKR